ncbi:MAG TPA: hypothetical protein VGC99_20135 [Candidatus Tectomicrobia bacterium]
MAVIYALPYLFVQKSPVWFFLSAGIGRLLIFSLLFACCLRLSREFREFFHPLIMLGIFTVARVGTVVLANSSDALFAVLSGLALASVLAYIRTTQVRQLSYASLFVGLATLTRPDGFVLFSIFAALSFILATRNKTAVRAAFAVIGPYVGLLGVFILVSGLTLREAVYAILERSYQAFEQGQWVVTQGDWSEAVTETRRIFGSPESNQGSILMAVVEHPEAYLLRLRNLVDLLPKLTLNAYDNRLAPVLFLLALGGAIELARAKRIAVLVVMIAWPMHLLVYFLTFFREGYLLMAFPVVIALASVGLVTTWVRIVSTRSRAIWSIFLVLLIAYSAVTSKPTIFASLSIFLGGLWLIWLARDHLDQPPMVGAVCALIALSMGIVLRRSYPFPNFYKLGSAPEERAVLFMGKNLRPGSVVGTVMPLPAVAARMFDTEIPDLRTAGDLLDWVDRENVSAIYVDGVLRTQKPESWAVIAEAIDNGLVPAFLGDPGSIQVLLVRSIGSSP